MSLLKLTMKNLESNLSATGFVTPLHTFCVCNHVCQTTKRYGRDYISRPAAFYRLTSNLLRNRFDVRVKRVDEVSAPPPSAA